MQGHLRWDAVLDRPAVEALLSALEATQATPMWSMTHFDEFLKVNSTRFVGKLTSKVNSRSEYATKTLLAVQGDSKDAMV
jgi:hypothetical protein